MNVRRSISRRNFLGAAAASTSAVMLTANHSSLAAISAPVSSEGETDHFWYRLAPRVPYIDSQRGNKAFGFGGGRIFLSEDNGLTWRHRTEFADAENITFSCILKNGNILFATRTRLY